MAVPDVSTTVRYVTNAKGEKTDVLVPLPTWEALLASWEHLVEALEDQEDRVVLQEWLQKRAEGTAEIIPFDDLGRELIADEPLPGAFGR